MIDLPREFIANHLHIDLLPHVVPNSAHEIFVNPGLKLAHPIHVSAYETQQAMLLDKGLGKRCDQAIFLPTAANAKAKRRMSYHKVVFASPPCDCPPADPGSPPLPP